MKNVQLKLAIIGAFSVFSATSMSAGFVNIPTTGFSGSAYTRCMAQPTTIGGSATTVGNFGSGSTPNGNPTPTPTTTANNTCATSMWGQVLHCDISDFRLSPWPDHYAQSLKAVYITSLPAGMVGKKYIFQTKIGCCGWKCWVRSVNDLTGFAMLIA